MARNTKTRSKERLLFNKGPSLSPLMRCRRALWLQRRRILVAEKREVKRHWASFSLSSVHHIRVSHTLWTAAPGWCTLPPIPRLEYFQVKGILSNSLSIKKKRYLMEVVMHPCLAEGWFRVYLHYDYDLIQGRRFFFIIKRFGVFWFDSVWFNTMYTFIFSWKSVDYVVMVTHDWTVFTSQAMLR